MDIVGGKDSLSTTLRGNCCILTIIDCFLRFALAFLLPDKTSHFIIYAVLASIDL